MKEANMLPQILSTLDLFGVEKIFCVQGAWLTICHAAHLSGDQSILIENLPHAITHLLKRHPRMRSRVHIDHPKYTLELLDYAQEYFPPNLFYSIVDLKDQSWEKIVEDECHRNPYSENGQIVFPLFHFMVLRNEEQLQSNDEHRFHLLLFSNHCASDGRSGYILLNDLLTLVTSSDVKEHLEPINREIIPSLTELIPRPKSILSPLIFPIGKYLFKRDLRKLNDPQIPVKTITINGQPNTYPFQNVKFDMLFSSTSTSLCARLREKCHSQQMTLHGPLFASLILAIHKYFPKNLSEAYLKPLNIDMDFDMRARLPASPLNSSTVGYCVCLNPIKLDKKFRLQSTSFWSLAKQCLAKTNQALTNGDTALFAHFTKDLLEKEEVFGNLARCFPDGRVSEVNFSNVGKYPYSCDYNQGQLRLRGLHVVNNGGIYHTSTCFWTCCAGDGQLDISIAHEMEDKEKAKEFLQFYIRLIETCAEADANITLQQILTKAEQF